MQAVLTDLNPTNIQQQTVKKHLEEYSIVHKIKGRLRLKIPRLAGDEDYAFNLEQLILKSKIITEYRLNPAAASLVVSYNEESSTEAVILDYLETIILSAAQPKKVVEILPFKEQNFGLSMLAMVTALVAAPFELPFVLVGGLIVVAAAPLWHRLGKSQDGLITFDSLDAIWLSSQLIMGNGIAGALALNLSQIGESLRQTQIQQIENELYRLYEQEEPEIQFSSRQEWLKSIEETELLQQVKPLAKSVILPTLALAGLTVLLTNDLGRASAWLPLNLGLSLRGITPLAIVSSLTAAAESGIYIRNGKTLEKLAQVDTLLLSLDSLQAGDGSQLLPGDFVSGDLHIVSLNELATPWSEKLAIPDNNWHIVSDSQEIDQIIQALQEQGHKVAWVEDNQFKATKSDIVISRNAEEADVILHRYDLRALIDSLNLADETLATIYQSMTITTSLNLAAVGMGVILGLDPVITVLINGAAAILGELNSLRLQKKIVPVI